MPPIAKPDIPPSLLRCPLHSAAGVERWEVGSDRGPALDPGFVAISETMSAHYTCGCVVTVRTPGVTLRSDE